MRYEPPAVKRSHIDLVAVAVVGVMAVAALYEAAVALQWIPVGDLPGEGARFEGFFLFAGWLAMLSGFVISLVLAVVNHRWTPGLALGAVAAALVTAHAYSFNTYDLPSLIRYTESGTPSAAWVAKVVLAGLFASLLSVMFPRIGFVATAAVLLVCLFTYTFTGCCN